MCVISALVFVVVLFEFGIQVCGSRELFRERIPSGDICGNLVPIVVGVRGAEPVRQEVVDGVSPPGLRSASSPNFVQLPSVDGLVPPWTCILRHFPCPLPSPFALVRSPLFDTILAHGLFGLFRGLFDPCYMVVEVMVGPMVV